MHRAFEVKKLIKAKTFLH